MRGVNKVILIGNLGKDPECKTLEGGVEVAKFTLATTESYQTKEGQKRSETYWHTIIVWRGLAGLARNFLHKGSLVYVEGRLRPRSFTDAQGVQRWVAEVLADSVVMLDKGQQKSGEDTGDADGEWEMPF